MLLMEIKLTASALCNLIYIDNSLTTELFYMYKVVNMIKYDDSFVSSIINDN